MIVGLYVRTLEDAKGVVNVQVTMSDLSGAKVDVLVRYGDTRADKQYVRDVFSGFDAAIAVADAYFQKEAQDL